MKEPSSLKDFRAFLGLVDYHGQFIAGFRKPADTLYNLTNKSKKFEWSIEFKNAVPELKKKLSEVSVLGYPIERVPHTLTTDASVIGVEAIRTQKQGTEDRVFAYASRTLSKNLRNCSAAKQKSFAIVHFTQHFKN